MPHSKNIISSIMLPNGTTYQIHDNLAIHIAEELGLSSALVFKGTKDTEAEILALTTAKVGDVWLAKNTNAEFVCVTAVTGTASASSWEKLGDIHNAASSTHTHNVTVTGTNAASSVTGSVTVPTVSVTKKYLTATASEPTVTINKTIDSVLGAGTTFRVVGGTASTTKLSATASGTAVGANGTVDAITGFEAHTTDTALGTGATFTTTVTPATSKMVTSKASKVTLGTAISASQVSANDVDASKVSVTAGEAATWGASVSSDGVLSVSWTTNTPTAVTSTAVTASKVNISNVSIPNVTDSTDVTVATGSLSTSGTGSTVVTGITSAATSVNTSDSVAAITALGKPKVATVLTGVKVTAQPTVKLSSGTTGDVTVVTGVSAVSVKANEDDPVFAMTGVTATITAPTITLTNNASSSTGAVENVSSVTVGTTTASVSGTAAAQKWTMNSGSTGQPV